MNFNELFEQIWAEKIKFLVAFFLIFTFSYVVLLALDFLPEAPKEESTEANTEEVESETEEVIEVVPVVEEKTNVLPLQLRIEKLDRLVNILNPDSRAIADLDNALLNGVVRHPDSATLGQAGNVFILGHSSYLPNVFNKNFQAFNGIQDLVWGDLIELRSADEVFVYRVEKVYRAKAKDVTVPIAGEEKVLTIATCNSFGTVDDRYIVEAKQIEVRNL